ncbi:MAG: histidinol-phosphatase HisJ family protein [Christensenellales bacterium]|jgi:histidinol-phosphatase (PHP family)
MRIRSTPHCHTPYADGKSTAEELVRAAIDADFVSIGISEHGQQRFDREYCMSDEDLPRYLGELRALREAYADRIRLHIGIERDLYSHAAREDFEYVLGACHYIFKGEAYCAADGAYETLTAFRDAHFGGSGEKMAAEFFRVSGAYALDYRPDIFAHFDLIQKQNKGGRLYNPENKICLDAAFEALEMIYASGALLEVNTGGMARGFMDTPYPAMPLLKRWHELGGRVIAGSDCHYAPHIAFGFEMLPGYLAEAGFDTAWRLGGAGEELFVEFPIR